MWTYLGSVWGCRRFWLSLVVNDLRLRYRRSVLGVGWSLLHPLTSALVMGLVFSQIFKIPIREFLPYILSGLACWSYLTGAVTSGCQSYVQAEPYIRQHPLPLAVYPLRTTLGALIHFLIALTMVFLIASLFSPPHNTLAVGLLLPAIVLYLLFGWAVAILAGFVNTVFRDLQHILDIVFQIVFYLTPIMYPPNALAGTPVGWVLSYNPLVPFLRLIREPLLAGQMPSLKCYAVVAGVTAVVLVAAMTSLHYQQKRIIFHL